MLAVICFLFLVCSLGLGLLISTFSRSQTQAIQFSVFFLLAVFFSGAFAPLEQLPADSLPFRTVPAHTFLPGLSAVNMYHAGAQFYVADLAVLLAGALITFLARRSSKANRTVEFLKATLGDATIPI